MGDNEANEEAPNLEQADDSTLDSSTRGNSIASVFNTVEFKRWERRKAKNETQELRADFGAALQQNNAQNNATILLQLSTVTSNHLAPMQQSLVTTQQKVGALQTAQTTMQMSLATTIEAEVQRQIEQSNVVTQNLRGEATTQTQEAVAHLKAAKLKYDKAAKALQDHMQRKTQQLASMEAQFKEWQKSANQLEDVKKKTGTLQQIQQGIEASQRDLHETKSQVEVLMQAARDLQAQQPQSVADQSMQLMLRQSSTG